MEITPLQNEGAQPRRHRRRHRKSSKQLQERWRRWKQIGIWLAIALVAGAAVAAIAVFAGSSSA